MTCCHHRHAARVVLFDATTAALIMPSVLYMARCLKIAEKVSFNIASEASYFFILTVLPDMLILIRQKLLENAKIQKLKM